MNTKSSNRVTKENFLLVEGVLQNQDGVINVRASAVQSVKMPAMSIGVARFSISIQLSRSKLRLPPYTGANIASKADAPTQKETDTRSEAGNKGSGLGKSSGRANGAPHT